MKKSVFMDTTFFWQEKTAGTLRKTFWLI